VRASEVELDGSGRVRCVLHVGGESRALSTQLLGSHMVYALLAAAAVASARGAGLPQICERLSGVRPASRRMERIELPNGVTILDDTYKASWESIQAAIETLRALRGPRRVFVFGGITEPMRSPHVMYKELGGQLAGCVERLILVGSSNLEDVVKGAVRAGIDRAVITHVGRSMRQAADVIQREWRPGDVVLIKAPGANRAERIALMLQGQAVTCPVVTCKVKPYIACARCPLRTQPSEAFNNVHLRDLVRLAAS
jgi:UDP-N-acetylmuramoyl-tripeptide--D-alanyl-D-alanine ligase